MNLTETVEALKARQKKAQLISILPIFLCALAAGLMIAKLPAFGGGVAGMALVLYFTYVRKVKGEYSDAVAETNIRFGLCEGLDRVKYTGRKGLTTESLDALAMLPIQEKSSLLVRQGFSGESKGLTLKGWEMTFNFPEKGETKTRYQFLSGTILTAEGGGETDPAADWLLLRTGLLSASVETDFVKEKGYRTCGCPEELGETFHVYTRGDLDQLPAHWAKRLEKLIAESPALGAFRLSPTRAAVYLRSRFYTEAVKPGFLPSEAQFRHNPLPERDGVWELFRYWGSAGA